LIYEFSGTVLSFLNLYNIVPAVALLPWIGWSFLRSIESRSWKRLLLFGLLLVLQVIAFEPLLFLCVVFLLAALALIHMLQSDNRGTDGNRPPNCAIEKTESLVIESLSH